jgi:hypothetical protein
LHAPAPSQLDFGVATPPTHCSWPHATSAPARRAHRVRSPPSHAAAAHGSLLVPAAHGGRVRWGAPLTGAHVPSAPPTSHASHWPVHAPLQQ